MAKDYIPLLSQVEKSLDRDISNLERNLSGNKTLYEKSQIRLSNIRDRLIYGYKLIQATGYFKDDALAMDSAPAPDIMKQITEFIQSQPKELTETISLTATAEKNSKNKSRKLVLEYQNVFKDIVSKTDPLTTFGKLINILSKWYQRRFIDNTSAKHGWKRFAYKLAYIKEWVCAIVIYFAYCHERGEEDNFLDEFDGWLNQLGRDHDITTKYSLPYAIQQCNRNMDNNYCTTSALILWDMLLDAGYMDLCKKRNLYTDAPAEDELWHRIEQYAPDLLEDYDGYQNNLPLLDKYKFLH